MKLLLFISFTVIAVFYGAAIHAQNYNLDTMIKIIGNGFKIEYSDSKNGSLLVVKHNDKQVYSDTSRNYVLDDSYNPTFISVGKNVFELYLEMSGNGPNKEYFKMLKIQSDKVVDSQVIPIK